MLKALWFLLAVAFVNCIAFPIQRAQAADLGFMCSTREDAFKAAQAAVDRGPTVETMSEVIETTKGGCYELPFYVPGRIMTKLKTFTGTASPPIAVLQVKLESGKTVFGLMLDDEADEQMQRDRRNTA